MVFAKTVEQLTWTSTIGFLEKSEKGKQRNSPERGKKLEKQCFSNKSLLANIVVSQKKIRVYCWRIRVSIPVPPACEAGALPFELIPRNTFFNAKEARFCVQTDNND